MNTCPSAESLHDYYYDYYNSVYPPTEPYYSNSDSSMDSGLQAVFFGLVSKDVDMEEYVQHVYGVSKADVEYIRSKEWKLEGLPTYTKLLDEGAPEEDLYEPFKTIMAALFDTFIDSGRKLDVHHASLGKTPLKGIWNARKPGQLFLFGSHDDESPVAWSLAKAFVEFAVTPRTQRAAAGDSTISTTSEEGIAAAAAPASSTSELALTTNFSTKRKHCGTDTPDEPKPAPKRPRLAAHTQKEPQAAGLGCNDDSEEDGALFEASTSPPAPSILPPAPPGDIDVQTLGGCLTYETFLAALNGATPRRIPKEYREYAKQLIGENEPPVVNE
ncbi:hypothetical protein EYR40_010190 [Pleurotus pulmonarius]|nr:hypothetical protein EYR36_010414 [Pleurotus pulmonarius]KAF4588637.1 hypothetical protein EYR40_010190 [Pleurotus pulmonarius]